MMSFVSSGARASCSIVSGEAATNIWRNPTTRARTTVPRHPGDLPKGTIAAIIRQAGLSVDEFLGL